MRPARGGRRPGIDCTNRETWGLHWSSLVGDPGLAHDPDDAGLGLELWLVARPELSFLWVRASRLAGKRQRWSEAVRLAEVAYSIEPRPETSFWIGHWLIASGRAEEAVPIARRTVDLHRRGKRNAWHRHLLARALASSGQLDAAEQELQAAIGEGVGVESSESLRRDLRLLRDGR